LEAFGQVQDGEAQVCHDMAVADTVVIFHPVEGTASMETKARVIVYIKYHAPEDWDTLVPSR
jgi:hypothetical protein